MKPARFRPDIEGLRAVAVGLVLWYHAGLPWLTGGFAGVDVFFVISGFLITSQLVKEVERSGTVSLPRFYARRAKRLFPAAATVLVATAIMTWLVLPKTVWRDYGGDIAASAAYIINWRLAGRSVDYLAEDINASPVQHFWSLAVEEQYYIVWPLLILVLALLLRRFRLPTRPTMAIGLAVAIAIPSFIWSVYLTGAEPARAYFVTTTRLWELAIGALVAIGATVWTRLPARAGALLGWAGLAAIAIGALTQSTSTPWPGSAAALPVLGAAAVLVGGFTAGRSGAVAVLGLRPMVWIGGLSYSLYLWHWPMAVAAQTLWPGNAKALVATVAASLIPSWLAYRFIENPVRHAKLFSTRARPALLLGAGLSITGVVAGLALVFLTPTLKAIDPAEASGPGVYGSSAPTLKAVGDTETSMYPDPLKAVEDIPRAYDENCQVDQDSSENITCTFGDPEGSRTIALIGDSKALQWLPGLEIIAKERGWKIVTHTKSACPVIDEPVASDDGEYTSCREWGKAVRADLMGADRPDLIITSSGETKTLADKTNTTPNRLTASYARTWDDFAAHGIPVIVLADTPHPRKPVYECVAEHPDTFMTECTFRSRGGLGTKALRTAAEESKSAVLLDFTPWQCPEGTCPPVIGNVLVYRQGSHITATWAEKMAPVIGAELDTVLPEVAPKLVRP